MTAKFKASPTRIDDNQQPFSLTKTFAADGAVDGCIYKTLVQEAHACWILQCDSMSVLHLVDFCQSEIDSLPVI